MELSQRIEEALKEAMKARDENRLNAVRLLMTALKVKEKEIKRSLNEAEIQQVISGQIKQRRDSVDQYGKADRQDLAAREEEEIRVLQGFLPEPFSEEELERIVAEAISQVGATSARDMGKVMKVLMPKVAGKADGKLVNELVRKKL